jgi:hypothetical protein
VVLPVKFDKRGCYSDVLRHWGLVGPAALLVVFFAGVGFEADGHAEGRS